MWTPPGVTRELEHKTSEYAASVEQMVDRLRGTMDRFNRELKRMDPYLELIFVKPNAEGLIGAKPGYYHLLRRPPVGPLTLIPITGPNGEFAEPDSGVFEWLAKQDMWSSQARHERERIQAVAREAEQRQREREDEERREELIDRYNAAFRTSVSMAGKGWTQTAKARKG